MGLSKSRQAAKITAYYGHFARFWRLFLSVHLYKIMFEGQYDRFNI